MARMIDHLRTLVQQRNKDVIVSAKKTKKQLSKKKKKSEEAVVEKPLTNTLVLEEKLSIAGASALKQTLSSFYADDSDITIDASAVSSADTSAIQLLLAFSEGIAKQSRKIIWKDNSDSFLESSRELGLDKYFHLDNSGEASDDEENLCPVF